MEDKEFFDPGFDMRTLIIENNGSSDYNENDNICKKCKYLTTISYLRDVGRNDEIVGEIVNKKFCSEVNLDKLTDLLYDENMYPIIYDCSSYSELINECRKVYY
jgi:hypothetical protein